MFHDINLKYYYTKFKKLKIYEQDENEICLYILKIKNFVMFRMKKLYLKHFVNI